MWAYILGTVWRINYSIDLPISMGPALLLAAIFGAHAAKLQGTLCVSTFSYYYYYYSSFFCHGMSMAAHRTVCQKVVKFGTQVKDSCMFNSTQLHVANKHALAPPMGQSFRYICAHNFWPVGPIFKNKVPLDSLDHADFNAPYDVIMRHNRFSAIFDFVESAKKVSRVAIFDWFSWKSTETIFRPIRTKVT